MVIASENTDSELFLTINSNIFGRRVTPVNIIGFSQNLVGFVFGPHRTNLGGGT